MIQKIGKTDESIKNLQEEYGKSLQYGTELEGLKQERQALEVQFKKAKKEAAEISKQTKDPEKVKKSIFIEKEKMEKLEMEIEEIEERKTSMKKFASKN